MALFALTDTFVFIDLSNTTEHVDGSDLIDTGFWSSSTSYAPNNVVRYGDALFVCLAANTGKPPTTSSRGAFWAILVKTNALPPPPSPEEVYEIATSGSNLAYALYGSTGSSGDYEPEGFLQGTPPQQFFQFSNDGTVSFWIKVTGVNTNTGWICYLRVSPPPQS